MFTVIDGLHLLAQHLVHSHHVNPVRSKDGSHRFVTTDVPLVFRILEIPLLDIGPKRLDRLGS